MVSDAFGVEVHRATSDQILKGANWNAKVPHSLSQRSTNGGLRLTAIATAKLLLPKRQLPTTDFYVGGIVHGIINDAAKRAARHAAITQIWAGEVTQVWADILHTVGQRYFIPSFIEYLRHT